MWSAHRIPQLHFQLSKPEVERSYRQQQATGCTRRDEISNLTTRSELQIFNVNYKITDNTNECHGHIQGMGR
jgi:hypothetical protein